MGPLKTHSSMKPISATNQIWVKTNVNHVFEHTFMVQSKIELNLQFVWPELNAKN